uniref:Metaxin glutathione S-transferase domain-containing protein n=1 Tax=Clastoptera arizonana TaxID=38151 RepID=A0A1B6CDZ3_9HEMI
MSTIDETKLSPFFYYEDRNNITPILYLPTLQDQVLLPDYANCLVVETLLRMCNIKYEICCKNNVEEMSPNGEVPFLKFGSVVISGFKPMVDFLLTKNIGLPLKENLNSLQVVERDLIMSMCTLTFENAEKYFIWFQDANKTLSESRYGSKYPWPLNIIKVRRKVASVHKQLYFAGWSSKTQEDVLKEVDLCCRTLSINMQSNQFIFGKNPSVLDALLFGHIFAIISTKLPNELLKEVIFSYPKLICYSKFVEHYFWLN